MENLAESLFARFGLPFSLLATETQRGFAGACNLGLGRARGRVVAFLNSDAFPEAPGWLPRLAVMLADDPQLALVAPLLLHPDGTIQHAGMAFRRVPRMGNWHVPYHLRLGQSLAGLTGLRDAECITGAAIIGRTEVIREAGGFDEGFILGDYEDADLCLRLQS
jgi:GT2 family glycosyltransferase